MKSNKDTSPLIQVDELDMLLAGQEVGRPVLLDVRYRMGLPNGREGFELAHVPGASYVDTHLLLDARPADRFRGENETVDPVAGHIPGAVSVPALANVDKDGRFLPADELAGRFQRLGAADAEGTTTTAKAVGTYCGSGVQATHLALALSVAGSTDEADVYIGSWSDWINDPDRPIALG